jgi:hypothetical protein
VQAGAAAWAVRALESWGPRVAAPQRGGSGGSEEPLGRAMAGHAARQAAAAARGLPHALQLLQALLAGDGGARAAVAAAAQGGAQGLVALLAGLAGRPQAGALAQQCIQLLQQQAGGDSESPAAAAAGDAGNAAGAGPAAAAPQGGGASRTLRHCAACGKAGRSLKCCARCRAAYYCEPACQRRHWKEHKQHCSAPHA